MNPRFYTPTIERLQKRLEVAMAQAQAALNAESEAARRYAQDPSAGNEWVEANVKSRRARLEFESAQRAYFRASRKP